MNPCNEFYKALARAQGELDGAIKDAQNPHLKSRYADLESCWEAWRKVGPRNGFAIIQRALDAGERQGVLLETTLAHTEGFSISSTLFMPAAKLDAQAFGSALTYARRYALCAMVGITPTEDDGEAAMPTRQQKPGPTTAQQADVRLSLAVQKFNGDMGAKLTLAEEIKGSILAPDRRAGLLKQLEAKHVQ